MIVTKGGRKGRPVIRRGRRGRRYASKDMKRRNRFKRTKARPLSDFGIDEPVSEDDEEDGPVPELTSRNNQKLKEKEDVEEANKMGLNSKDTKKVLRAKAKVRKSQAE